MFNYSITITSYSAINDGYLDYIPVFTDEIQASPEVEAMCGGNAQCVYDATVTGDMTVGQGTLDTSMENDETVQILGQCKQGFI